MGGFMTPSEVSLEPLKKALQQLLKAIAQPENEFIRDSVIQRFEFTFELCWRTLQRFLEFDRPLPDTSTRTILREALAQNLIADLDTWFAFQKNRNLTSHIYSEEMSIDIYNEVKKFPPVCEALILKLTEKQKADSKK
jgi:nucleotidyltransferase substrate binding protein (TIGR01987 family)